MEMAGVVILAWPALMKAKAESSLCSFPAVKAKSRRKV
jgi:hypothetical protein